MQLPENGLKDEKSCDLKDLWCVSRRRLLWFYQLHPVFGSFSLFLKGGSHIKPRGTKPFSSPVTDGGLQFDSSLIPLTDRRRNKSVTWPSSWGTLKRKQTLAGETGLEEAFSCGFRNLKSRHLKVRIQEMNKFSRPLIFRWLEHF